LRFHSTLRLFLEAQHERRQARGAAIRQQKQKQCGKQSRIISRKSELSQVPNENRIKGRAWKRGGAAPPWGADGNFQNSLPDGGKKKKAQSAAILFK
jgi:hypothetical protein